MVSFDLFCLFKKFQIRKLSIVLLEIIYDRYFETYILS